MIQEFIKVKYVYVSKKKLVLHLSFAENIEHRCELRWRMATWVGKQVQKYFYNRNDNEKTSHDNLYDLKTHIRRFT